MKYAELAELYHVLESTSKRLVKTRAIAEMLAKAPSLELPCLMLLLQGRIFPAWSEEKIGVAAKLVMKAIALAVGRSPEDIEKDWKKTGDLGVTVQQLMGKKRQSTLFSESLSIEKVFNNIQKLATATGEGSVDRKVKLIAELLTSATPLEAKYIVRSVLEDLRVGVGEAALRDAIVWAFFGKQLHLKLNEEKLQLDFGESSREKYNEIVDIVQHAYDLNTDFAEVAKVAKEEGLEGLKKIGLRVGTPIQVMLFTKAADIKDAFEMVGSPAAIEYKYDGFRVQIHKDHDKVTVYTRRLENVTAQFNELKDIVLKHVKADEAILDAEAVGMDAEHKKYLPFQTVSQRIKRKYDIEKMAEKFPVEINVFDVLQYNGKNLLAEPFVDRRAVLIKIIKPLGGKIVSAQQFVTSDLKQAEKFYKEALGVGIEGVMVKSLTAPYQPGKRVGYGAKVKPTMENLDLVIVGAEWGTGKRAGWFSSFSLACQDEDGNFLPIGKVGTGFNEKEDESEEGVTFDEMTRLLKPLILEEKGREVGVKPKI